MSWVGVTEACRSAGYWSTHSGYENKSSTDQPDTALAKAQNSITICGQTINAGFGATSSGGVDHQTSPVEAMCVPTKGDLRSHLVSQLTAAALNCVANGLAADCSNSASFGPAFAACSGGAMCSPSSAAN